jgi:shikimate dehydrogenase
VSGGRFATVSGHTLVFGLIGHPVRHSLSPAIHNRLFQDAGVDALYACFDVHPDQAPRVGAAIRTLDLRGVNLTVPFKAAILNDLDQVTRAVEEAHAANVVIHHDGHLTGYNTDGEGFVRGLEAEFGPVCAESALILGAGGAGRAVAAALADRGVARVTLMNRTLAASEEAVAHLSAYFPKTRYVAAPLSADAFVAAAPGAGLVVNCAAGPAAGLIDGLDVDRLDPDAIWCDINYWMASPPALARCRARGLRVQDGLPMLVHQGALSFELFTGVPVDPAHIRANLG